jgi:glycosyltransferase involved in cell wall biosynthesis
MSARGMTTIEPHRAPVPFAVVKPPADADAVVEISVVVPVYNRARELERALASIAAQTRPVAEVIVVDDRSTDRSVEAACAFRGPFEVVVLRHERNAGASAARNTGLAAARGRWVGFLDSDDEWLPEKIERQLARLEQNGSGDLVLLGRMVVRSPLGDTIEPAAVKAATVSIGDYLFRQRGIIQLGTMLLPARFAQAIRFEVGQQVCEDWEFCLGLEEAGAEIRMLEEPLLVWYDDRRGDRLSLSAPPEVLLDWLERHAHRLSPAAVMARKATIAPRLRDRAPWQALGWIVRARLQGASSTASCIGQLCRLIHPPAYLWLQRLTGKGSAT